MADTSMAESMLYYSLAAQLVDTHTCDIWSFSVGREQFSYSNKIFRGTVNLG